MTLQEEIQNGESRRPKFLEIGDMLRVNFYRPSYKQNGDKSVDKAKKTAIKPQIGDKSAINRR
ncbi:MAG: hypothetical protein PUI24_06495 [Spirochaetales bacterium]|nr:hypothetical protein [Spirochaetales bacterium]MDY2923276.1 hypothetical protein [Treponema sp.]MDY5682544.1 hypothetical protein [Treponema sp.]